MQNSTDPAGNPTGGSRAPRGRVLVRWWTAPTVLARERWRRIWLTSALVLFFALLAIASTSIWNYYGLSLPIKQPIGDVSAVSQSAQTLSIASPARTPEWVRHLGDSATSPAIWANATVYVVLGHTPETGRILALDDSDGSTIWEVKLDSIGDFSPVVAGNTVYVGTRAGDLFALDRTTGGKVWVSDLGPSVVGSPEVRNGIVYAASDAVYALDATTGHKLWIHNVGGSVARSVHLSANVLAAIGSDGHVNLMSAVNGRHRLTFPLWFGTSAGPTAVGNVLVIPGDRANVQALNITVRDIPMEKAVRFWWTKLWLWDMAPRPPLPRGYLWQNRGLDGDTAYALGADDQAVFLAIDHIDGSGSIVALDPVTGEARWHTETESRVLAPAVIARNALVVGLYGGTILAIDSQSGGRLWEWEVEVGLAAAPTLSESGRMLVPTRDRRLIAFR